jgi:hypothetical protein
VPYAHPSGETERNLTTKVRFDADDGQFSDPVASKRGPCRPCHQQGRRGRRNLRKT